MRARTAALAVLWAVWVAAVLALSWVALLALRGGSSGPTAPLPYGPLEVTATALPLNPRDPAQTGVGSLTYAGGIELATAAESRLRGLSGLDVAADGVSFIAVSDFGDLVRGRLVLDAGGRLMGVASVTVEPLQDVDGRRFRRKRRGDSEDISFTEPTPSATSGFAVAFEQNSRVLAYPKAGAPAQLVFKPGDARFGSSNKGLEGLAARCSRNEDRGLWVGSEMGRLSNRQGDWMDKRGLRRPEHPWGYQLAGLANRTCQDIFVLYRSYDPFRGFRTVIGQTGRAGPPILARLSSPLSRGNFEGIAAVDRSTPEREAWRLYLVSDDGFDPRGPRTLLMAFDWVPPAKSGAQ